MGQLALYWKFDLLIISCLRIITTLRAERSGGEMYLRRVLQVRLTAQLSAEYVLFETVNKFQISGCCLSPKRCTS